MNISSRHLYSFVVKLLELVVTLSFYLFMICKRHGLKKSLKMQDNNQVSSTKTDTLLTLLNDPVVIKSPVGGEIDTLAIAARTNSNPQHPAVISYNNFMASDMSQNGLRQTTIRFTKIPTTHFSLIFSQVFQLRLQTC